MSHKQERSSVLRLSGVFRKALVTYDKELWTWSAAAQPGFFTGSRLCNLLICDWTELPRVQIWLLSSKRKTRRAIFILNRKVALWIPMF
jgi:hypothetical protein